MSNSFHDLALALQLLLQNPRISLDPLTRNDNFGKVYLASNQKLTICPPSPIFFFVLSTCSFMHRDTRPAPLIHCRMLSNGKPVEPSPAPDHRSEARLRIDPKVLVFVETTYSRLGRDIAELLVYNRIK